MSGVHCTKIKTQCGSGVNERTVGKREVQEVRGNVICPDMRGALWLRDFISSLLLPASMGGRIFLPQYAVVAVELVLQTACYSALVPKHLLQEQSWTGSPHCCCLQTHPHVTQALCSLHAEHRVDTSGGMFSWTQSPWTLVESDFCSDLAETFL